MLDPLTNRLRDALTGDPALLPPGAAVLIALSGGPDSMALLHLLSAERSRYGWTLFAAHFDHATRSGSAREAEGVVAWAAELGIDCAVGRSPKALAGSQAAFRSARYEFLHRQADQRGCDRIAVAHHADDQAETVWFRLARGTGLRGLCGIPARRGRIARPLLGAWREEIDAYLTERGIPSLQDPSNRDPRWSRARIRYDRLPREERRDPNIRRRLIAIARTARELDRDVEREATALLDRGRERSTAAGWRRFEIARSALHSYDPEVQARVVRRIAGRLGASLSGGGTRSAVEFIKRGRSGMAIDLSGRLQVGREFGDLWFGFPSDLPPDQALSIPDHSVGRGSARLGGRFYEIHWGPRQRVARAGWQVRLWRSGVEFPLMVRGPLPGDRIRTRAGSRKLKKVFNESRVPLSERPARPVVVARDGRILWVAGLVSVDPAPADRDGGHIVIGVDEERSHRTGSGDIDR